MTNSLVQIGDKSYKECQVVMLPHSNIDTQITMYLPEKELSTNLDRLQHHTNQHLYILSDEELKNGDWGINPITLNLSQHDNQHNNLNCGWKKVVTTTDSKLNFKICKRHETLTTNVNYNCTCTGDMRNLPRPSNEFIEAYVKAQGKGFEKILVEYEKGNYTGKHIHPKYSDNPELWYYWNLKLSPDNTITCKRVEKKSYSKEEILNWLQTRFTEYAPIEYVISEFKKEF